MPNFVLAVSIVFAALDLLAIISVLRLWLRSIKSIAIPIFGITLPTALLLWALVLVEMGVMTLAVLLSRYRLLLPH